MNFWQNLKASKIFKIAGLTILGVVVVVFVFSLVGSTFKTVFNKTGISNYSFVPSAPDYDSAKSFGEMAPTYGFKEESLGLSVRNVAPAPNSKPIYQNNQTAGDQAEAFEVTEYNANIESRELKNTCRAILDLKSRADVIFENANESDRNCNYVFKVKHDSVKEILALIKDLKPRDLSENTYTIKKLVDDYTGEIEILQKKLTAIDETLAKATSAYDEITKLATTVKDVESLAKIIDSKINIIERLTQERLNINSQLENIQRAKAEQLDRLEYTYFRVNVTENKFVDGQSLKDSWRAAVKNFVYDLNNIVQDLSINLIKFLFLILQAVVYILILLLVAKYGWRLVKNIWQK